MKIIDFEKKGNMVRFSLGKPELEEWWGDDWDDTPYEHNAGRVYDEYVEATRTIVFGFDDVVFEPCDGYDNSPWCKEDMIKRKVPCICVLKAEYQDPDGYYDFRDIIGNDRIIKYYFGDEMLPDTKGDIK